MTWFALHDDARDLFDPMGLSGPRTAPVLDTGADSLLPRGTLMMESSLPASPGPILAFAASEHWGLSLSLRTLECGGLSLCAVQEGELREHRGKLAEIDRTEGLRLTYTWDAPARCAILAVERTNRSDVQIVKIAAPKPIRVRDLQQLFTDASRRHTSPDLIFLAASSRVEPVGPRPALWPDTPVATPGGYVPAATLRRGDTVLTADHQVVPILHARHLTLPARGSFAPLRLRTPYFGLKRDITVATGQRLLISGHDVEYLFGREEVLLPCTHLSGTAIAEAAPVGPMARYVHLLLPNGEALLAAGTALESLQIGRLRRKSGLHRASCLSDVPRHDLPDHGAICTHVLRDYDARVLADKRVA